MASRDPAEPWAEVHRRLGDLWFRDRLGIDDTVELACVDTTIVYSDLFADVV